MTIKTQRVNQTNNHIHIHLLFVGLFTEKFTHIIIVNIKHESCESLVVHIHIYIYENTHKHYSFAVILIRRRHQLSLAVESIKQFCLSAYQSQVASWSFGFLSLRALCARLDDTKTDHYLNKSRCSSSYFFLKYMFACVRCACVIQIYIGIGFDVANAIFIALE